MSALERLEARLERLCGKVELARPRFDVEPLPMVAPRSVDETCELVRLAAADKLRVLPIGRGSKLGWCTTPGHVDFLLSTRNLKRVVSHVPDDGTITVEAGLGMDELAARWETWLRWRCDRVAAELNVGVGLSTERRRERMNAVNPCYVPRNYLLQLAIDAATEGDVAPLEALQQVLGNPYEKREGCERYARHRPDWARDRPGCSALSCSS